MKDKPTNAEVTVMAAAFIDQNEKNLIFRIYVPNDRLWAKEAERILQIFREYLSKVSQYRIRQNEVRSNSGTIYEFFGDHSLKSEDFSQQFEDFSKLLELCVENPTAATRILEEKKIEPLKVQDLVTRYAKEARRIHVDARHELERKILTVRHRMESELIEVGTPEFGNEVITAIINTSLPTSSGIRALLSPVLPLGPLQNSVTINIKPQIIENAQGIVAQEFSGTASFSAQANQLIELISRYGNQRTLELSTAFQELEDGDAAPALKTVAKNKLKSFLTSIVAKIGDAAFASFWKYLEHKAGIP